MTPIERFQALLDGKKIRCWLWDRDVFWEKKGDGVFGSNGKRVYNIESLLFENNIDKWELYEDPKPSILLTPDDVGRRVRLRNGSIALIIMKDEADPIQPYMTTSHCYYPNGCVESFSTTPYDIVEVYR